MKTKNAIISLMLILITFVSIFVINIPTVDADGEGTNWFFDWLYRKSHAINNATNAGVNYVVDIIVYYKSGVDSLESVYLNYECQPSFGDVRFTGSDGSTSLNFFIKAMLPFNYAIFCVQLAANISIDDTTIYIYYGKFGDSQVMCPYTQSPDPVMALGGAGQFDSAQQEDPFIFVNGSTNYVLYYTGYNGSKFTIGYSTSTDLVNWVRGGKCLDTTGSGYELVGVAAPNVHKLLNGTYFMYYHSVGAGGVDYGCLATSQDGVSWTKYNGGTPIMMPTVGTYYSQRYDPEVVIYQPDLSPTWISLFDAYNGSCYQTGRATSSDGVTWTPDANPVFIPAGGSNWDSTHSLPVGYVFTNNTYYLFYQAYYSTSQQWKIGIATSNDCLTWIRYAENPVLIEPFGLWSAEGISDPILVNGTYFCMFDPAETSAFATYYIYSACSSNTINTTSNGYTTFPFFDNFNGTSLDTGKWGTLSSGAAVSYTVNNGLKLSIVTTGTSWCHIYSLNTQTIANSKQEGYFFTKNLGICAQDIAISLNVPSTEGTDDAGFKNAYRFENNAPTATNNFRIVKDVLGSGAVVNFTTPAVASYYYDSISWQATGDEKFFKNSSLSVIGSDSALANGVAYLDIFLYGGNSGNYFLCSWFCSRPYVTPEPIHGIWGVIETYTTKPSYTTIGQTSIEKGVETTLYSYWLILDTTGANSTLSGYIFSIDSGLGYVNQSWTAFAATNNTWANLTLTITSEIGYDFKWLMYANSSYNIWNQTSVNTFTVQSTLTFYFSTGGQFWKNGSSIINGTQVTYTSAATLNFLAVCDSGYAFQSFNWTNSIGSTVSNNYDLEISNQSTVWLYFNPVTGGDEGVGKSWFTAGVAVAILIFGVGGLILVIALLRRR